MTPAELEASRAIAWLLVFAFGVLVGGVLGYNWKKAPRYKQCIELTAAGDGKVRVETHVVELKPEEVGA